MLEPRSVAVVGASARPGSFGERLAIEALRSPSAPSVYLVHPSYTSVQGQPAVPSLSDVPGPVDLVLVGVPDQEAGEVPKAYVVLKGEATTDELIAYVAERVAPYKKIRLVDVIDQIPKSASGKILRRVLLEQERVRASGS